MRSRAIGTSRNGLSRPSIDKSKTALGYPLITWRTTMVVALSELIEPSFSKAIVIDYQT